MAKLFVILLLLVNFLNIFCSYGAIGANILAVLPSVWKSHYIFGRRLLQHLVARQNHTVTLISPYASAPTRNMREIRIEGILENWLDMGLSFNVEQIRQRSIMERYTRLIYAGTTNVDLLLAHPQVRELLHSSERFDLLIVDLFLSDALLGLSHYYQIPTVVISPAGASMWLNEMLGNPHNTALDPSNFLPYTERMSIWERSVNTLMGLFEKLTYNFFHSISHQAIYKKHFEPLSHAANLTLPHHSELTKNLSLVLLNSQPLLHYPRAYLPNMLEIAGLHLYPSKYAKLPNHLKEFIEAAPSGVVYMSLGANVQTADLSREKLEAFLDVFSYMKDMHFLLKWELQQFNAYLPDNVMINEWFPQEIILAHPNVKVFITAGGLMSIVESIHGLTPMLAIPIYPKQEAAARRLQTQGVALTLSFDLIAYDAVLYGIQQLAFNTTYCKSMQRVHRHFWSDNTTPIAKSLHYIDVVLSTRGASFLQSHANHLNYFRTELFDVIAIIGLGVFCILAVPFFVICLILRKAYQIQANTSELSFHSPLVTTYEHSSASYSEETLRRRRTSASLSASSTSSSSSHVN